MPSPSVDQTGLEVIEVARQNLEYYEGRLRAGDDNVTHYVLTYYVARDAEILRRFTPMFPQVAASLLALRRDLTALAQTKVPPAGRATDSDD
jgi:hypothetical protein